MFSSYIGKLVDGYPVIRSSLYIVEQGHCVHSFDPPRRQTIGPPRWTIDVKPLAPPFYQQTLRTLSNM